MPIFIPNEAAWEDDVPAIQLGDLLLGDDAAAADVTGPLNLGRKALANRTLYLKGVVDGLAAQVGNLDFATQADINSAINGLIDGAPGALDTLNELAVALADNDSEIAALVASIATKLTEAQADARYHLKDGLLDVRHTASSHKVRLGYDVDSNPYVTGYRLQVLLGYLQWTPAYSRFSNVLGGDLRIKGVGVAEINGLRLATESHANNADNLGSGTVAYQRLPLSSEANAKAGTNGSTVMTPFRTHQAIAAAMAALGPDDIGSRMYCGVNSDVFAAGDSFVGTSLHPSAAYCSSALSPGGGSGGTNDVHELGTATLTGTWEALAPAERSPGVKTRWANFIKVDD